MVKYPDVVVFLILLTCSFHNSTAQTHEIGVRLNSFEDFDFIYKKERNENSYMRYRVASLQAGLIDAGSNGGTLTLNLNFALGWEKRKDIAEKLQFIHGWEPFVQLAFISESSTVGAGIGYVLGFQYNFSESFYLNLETIPSLRTVVVRESASSLIADFNSNAIALTLAYRFNVNNNEE